MNKILLSILIIVITFFIILGIIGLFYLGPIVKLGIEQVGPQITKVSVDVDGASVSLLSGSASIKGLVVGNPPGYRSPQAIKVGNISVSLDPFSVTSSKVMIHSVRVDSPEIAFEAGLGGNNLSKILSNVNSFIKNPSGPAPKIEIDDFVISGARVSVNIAGVVSKVVPLPDIHLTDLGKNSNGLTPVELTRAVLSAILTGTLKVVAGSAGSISQTVSSITSSLGSLFGK